MSISQEQNETSNPRRKQEEVESSSDSDSSSISEESSVVSSDSDSDDEEPEDERTANQNAVAAAQSGALRSRLRAFLPQMQAANQGLDTSRPSGFEIDGDGEDDEQENGGDEKRYVEMNLDLGVLEEKAQSDEQIRVREKKSEAGEEDEEPRRLRGLGGFNENQGEEKQSAGIEVVDDNDG